MAKKIVKKRKLKVFRLLLILLVIGGILLCGYWYLHLPILNIVVKGTSYLNDDYILELADIKNYPSFCLTNTKKIEDKLLSSPYIGEVDVKRDFYHKLIVEVKENKALFYTQLDKEVVFENGNKVLLSEQYIFRVPRILNYVPDNKYKAFLKGMKNINDDVLSRISDIEYQPNDFDKERFLLYMDDGNMVYLTLTKFKMINYYNDVLSQLEGRRGILYLDNGNHFQIKE